MSGGAIQIIEGQYFQDVLAQPAALTATLEWLRAPGRWEEVRGQVRSRSWNRIVLSGSVMNSAELFLPDIRAVIRRQCTQVPAERVALMPSLLRGDAPLIGAGVVWAHRYAWERH